MKSSRFRRLLLPLLLASAAVPASRVLGQSVTFGALSGRVVDGRGLPVSSAEIRAVDRASGAERFAVTGRDGLFRFGLIAAAAYDVSAEAVGFRPVVHTGVMVSAGSEIELTLRLAAAAPPVTTIDTVLARGRTSEPLSWLAERGYADLVGGRRLLSDAAGLSPFADAGGIEGLPWRHTDVMVDGARIGSLGLPRSNGLETVALAAPLRAMANVAAGGLGFDTEVGGTGVGLRAHALRAGGNGDWRSTLEGGTANYGAALAIGGALQRDTAYATVGVDYQRSEIAAPAWFPATDALGQQIAQVAGTVHGTALDAYTAEPLQLEQRWSAWGRFDWQQGDRLAITLRSAASRLVRANPPLLGSDQAALGSRYEALGAQFALNVLARLSPRYAAELRVSGDVNDSESLAPVLPATTIAARGITFGAATEEPFEESRATPRVTAMLHGAFGAHRVKAGLAVATHREETNLGALGGSYRFGDATDFQALAGAWYGVEAPPAVAFRTTESALFIQDVWRVTSGLEVTLGLRSDVMRYPATSLEENGAWATATGLDVPERKNTYSRVSPRLGFRWDIGSERAWVLEGGAGTFTELPDRAALAEALMRDRGLTARYGVGTLVSWPAAPTTTAAPVSGTALSLLGPEYEGPRTRRAALRLLRSFGGWSAYTSGVYRYTDFLSRRRDLNLPATASGTDQHGRPLFGALQQVGALVVAQPGANRRFAGFDAVHALESTGFSEFSAVSVGIDRVTERGLSFALNYTLAQTTDNLAGTLTQGLSPFPSTTGTGDWAEGRADVDAPQRILVAAEWRAGASAAMRLGAVFRMRSGAAFTPGFRDGVDANGDGDGSNDPAFIDPAMTGIAPLLDEWDCLRRQSGALAARNSCRAEWSTSLDLRAAFRLADLRLGRVALVVDALDVLAQTRGPIDRALVLVDRTGTLTTNPLTGVTTIPLVVNPNFGERLADRSPGILWRVGLRIGQ